MANDLEEIKNRLNIVDVLGEYIRLEKAGANWKATCPFHNEKTPSFSVNEEKQFWHCFGCQKHGDIFSFVMEMEGLEFREALKVLAEKAGVKLEGYSPQKAQEKNRTLEILELATKWYEYQLWNGPGKIKTLNYLRKRGLEDKTIKEFRLGYAPKGWRHALGFLTKRGYRIEEIEKTGLLVRKSGNTQVQSSKFKVQSEIQNSKTQNINCYDRFRERIMFPICDYSGKVVGFSARVAPGGDETQAKYVNTPETEVYHKSKILYGIDKAKKEARQKDSFLMVEGNMDVIAASQAGIKNVVAISGTALTEDQIKIIKRYTPNVKMFFDMDSAGETATKKSIKMGFANEMNVSVVTLPSGKDAADLAKDNPEKLIKAVSNALPAMEYFYKKTLSRFNKNNPEEKRKISEMILDMIINIENAIEKSHWIKKLGEDLSISEGILTGILKKATLKNRNEKKGDIQENNNINFRGKMDVLVDELIGLMLISEKVWKKVAKNKNKLDFLPEDSLLTLMLEKGKKCGFRIEKIDTILDREKKERAGRIHFEKKYQLDLNNNLEEVLITDPDRELEQVLSDINKENSHKKLQEIIFDLKVAEERKDQEAIKILRAEFNKISSALIKAQKKYEEEKQEKENIFEED